MSASRSRAELRHAVDPTLALVALTLLLIGLVAISSSSIEYADFHHANPWFHTQRHLLYLLVAATAGVLVYQVPLQFWQDTGWVWLFVALGLLILVLLPGIGREVNGSQRWLPLGPITVQPSEFAKAAMVIYMAGYMVRREHQIRHEWQGFLKPMAVLFTTTLLLMIEPDFGATVIVAASAFGMLFLAGVKLRHFLLVSGGAVAAMLVLVLSADYRVKRLTAYTDPWADPFDTGFQLTQSLIAFGRGEWLGVGLGNSVQKLFYLPEAHTDFVFSIWAEETGFIGALVVIALFAALIGRVLWVGRRALLAANPFGAHICYGVALVFAGQAFVNMGVSAGLLPTKGLTLPFVSYGGTSLIVCCAMLALVLRIERDTRSHSEEKVMVARAGAQPPLVLMMAGGTGGHVYPALAVALELIDRGHRVEWVGTRRGLEHRVVPAAGIALHFLSVRGVRGKSILDRALAAALLVLASMQALWLVYRLAPRAVVGMGGYVAGPAGVAAWILRKPLLIHEQNAVVGTTNRMLAPLASKVVAGLPCDFKRGIDYAVLGNPVRRELVAAGAARHYDYHGQRPLRLLVLGGSLGAQAINQAIPAVVAAVGAAGAALEVRHQAGAAHVDSVRSSYGAALGQGVQVEAFIEDMAGAYGWADLVLCRAGALTVAELAIMGCPAILVPLPGAIDDHQTANARVLSVPGAAMLMPQAQMTAAGLARALVGYVRQPGLLATMGAAAAAQARPDAAARVSDCCQELIHGH